MSLEGEPSLSPQPSDDGSPPVVGAAVEDRERDQPAQDSQPEPQPQPPTSKPLRILAKNNITGDKARRVEAYWTAKGKGDGWWHVVDREGDVLNVVAEALGDAPHRNPVNQDDYDAWPDRQPAQTQRHPEDVDWRGRRPYESVPDEEQAARAYRGAAQARAAIRPAPKRHDGRDVSDNFDGFNRLIAQREARTTTTTPT